MKAACVLASLLLLLGPLQAASPVWKAGVAKLAITPTKPLWMTGFGARTNISSGTLQELYAKALALEDESGRQVVLVTTDLLGFPAPVAKNISDQAAKQYGLSRERLLLNSSHTHGGPALAHPGQMLYGARASSEQCQDVENYTRELEGKVVAVIGAALKDLRPARLQFGQGETSFGVNRRLKTATGYASFVGNTNGPVDHAVPVLRVDGEDGRLRAVVFGYACHNTALLANIYQFHGDYAGFAQAELESQHPGVAALFVQGCGGDVGTSPRGTVELAQKYGQMLAAAVDKTLAGSLETVRGPLKPAFAIVPVAFAPPPTREALQAQLQHKEIYHRWHAQQMSKVLDHDGRLPTEYPYPLQVWQFGSDLTLVAMAGEGVVDYSLRLKKEFGADKLWVAGYCNDVFAYIPSLRVLQEGGYEGGDAMIYYVQPGPFAPSVEETIVGKIHDLVAATAPPAERATVRPRGEVGVDVPLSEAELAKLARRITVQEATAASVQAACDQAVKEGVPVVFLPAREYVFDQEVRVPGGLTLLGEGSKTVIRTRDRNTHLFRVEGDGVRFTRLRLHGGETISSAENDTYGISVFGKKNVRVDHCELLGFSYAANFGDEATAQVDHCSIHHNLREGLGYGVALYSGAWVLVSDNEFSQNRHSLASNGALDWSSPKRAGKYLHKSGVRKTHWEFVHNRVGSNDQSTNELCAVDTHPGMDGTFVVQENLFENLRVGIGIRDGSGLIRGNVFRNMRGKSFRPFIAITITYGAHNGIPVEGAMPHDIQVLENTFVNTSEQSFAEGVFKSEAVPRAKPVKYALGRAENIVIEGKLLPETRAPARPAPPPLPRLKALESE